MTSLTHGPEQTCQRSACAELEPHKAGRHLEQRDELYDGPASTLAVLPLEVRDSARRLVREAPALMPEVMDLAEHIEFLRRQVAAVRVDGDRREREAIARSGSCGHHGERITELEDQLRAMEQSYRSADAGRVALLGLPESILDLVRSHREGKISGDLTVEGLIDGLDKAAQTTSAAHARAWKR